MGTEAEGEEERAVKHRFVRSTLWALGACSRGLWGKNADGCGSNWTMVEEATTGPVRYASVYLATGAGGRGGAGKKSRRRVGPSGVGTPDPWRG